MAKDGKVVGARTPDTYGELVQRLESVVKQLETGELSLEDSLKAFEEGVGLVNRGEKLLGEAERRIEQLLEQGGQDQAAPLELPPTNGAPAPAAKVVAAAAAKPRAPDSEEDVPF